MDSDEEIDIVGWDDTSNYISHNWSPENQGSIITRTPSIHGSSQLKIENVEKQCSDLQEFLPDQKIKTETQNELRENSINVNIYYDIGEKVELTLDENDPKSYTNASKNESGRMIKQNKKNHSLLGFWCFLATEMFFFVCREEEDIRDCHQTRQGSSLK